MIAALFVSFWITRPIRQLTGYVNQIQWGRLETDIHISQIDEIGTSRPQVQDDDGDD